jgi:DNA invertase Pin-like site-specific DNA recombinase
MPLLLAVCLTGGISRCAGKTYCLRVWLSRALGGVRTVCRFLGSGRDQHELVPAVHEQAARGGEAEGFSIQAQREACRRKAEQLTAHVVAEFIDAGESARSADRPELQRMLTYLAEHPVRWVIVHKVDRLARNRADDVAINLAIRQAGATLVSVTENIDETPSGVLLHGIMSSIAEFYSRNLANEVVKGTQQKVRAAPASVNPRPSALSKPCPQMIIVSEPSAEAARRARGYSRTPRDTGCHFSTPPLTSRRSSTPTMPVKLCTPPARNASYHPSTCSTGMPIAA